MTRETSSWLRFIPVVALLSGAALFLQARSRPEHTPGHASLSSFPTRLGEWQEGEQIEIPPRFLEVLGPGEFLERLYQRAPDGASIDLFLAYFPSQRTGDTIHSPKNCLPGAGWTPIQAERVALRVPGGKAVTMNRYVVARGADRQLVLYWYQAHGRTQASEYWAKFYLVADAIRLNRTDGALVRLVTPLADEESVESGQQRATAFAAQIMPLLPSFIPN